MATIEKIKIRCEISDPIIGAQIATLALQHLNHEFLGEDYHLVAGLLEVATYAAVRSIRRRLHVTVATSLEENGDVNILVSPRDISELPEEEPEEEEEEEIEEVIEEEAEEEEAPPQPSLDDEIPHHRKYHPMYCKNDPIPRWGKTPGARRRNRFFR